MHEDVAVFDSSVHRITKVGDAIGGVAELSVKGIIDVEAYIVGFVNAEPEADVREK